MIHDIDILKWLFPQSTTRITSHSVAAGTGRLEVRLDLVRNDGTAIQATLDYRKRHPTYVQKVRIDHQTFGYEHLPPQGTTWPAPWPEAGPQMAKAWRGAYIRQFEAFAERVWVNGADPSESRFSLLKLWEGYRETFSLMHEIADLYAYKI